MALPLSLQSAGRGRDFGPLFVCLSHSPMDCRSPGSSVHGILQARILEWVAISIPIKFYLLFVYSLNELMHLFIIILVLNI